MTNKQSITIERDIPEGWKMVDFRVPKKGEWGISEQIGLYKCKVSLGHEGYAKPIVERINNEGAK